MHVCLPVSIYCYVYEFILFYWLNKGLHRYPGPPGRFRRPGDSKASRQGAHPAGVNGCVPIGYTRI